MPGAVVTWVTPFSSSARGWWWAPARAVAGPASVKAASRQASAAPAEMNTLRICIGDLPRVGREAGPVVRVGPLCTPDTAGRGCADAPATQNGSVGEHLPQVNPIRSVTSD